MKKTICILLMLVCSAGLFGCKSPGILYTVDGYDAFLREAARLPEEPSTPTPPKPLPPDLPAIPGLTLLCGGFDEATDYTYGYACVRKDGKRYAADKQGTLTALPDSAESFCGGYYIAADGLYYLGTRLTAARVERVKVADDVAIAVCADGYRVYVAGRPVAEAAADAEAPEFFNGLLLYAGAVCDFDLTPATLGEYMRMGAPNGGRIPITDGERFGYADETGGIAIPPQFLSGDNFSDGYATVCLADGRYAYIDPAGEILRADEPLYFTRPPYPFHDGYGLVDEDALYLVSGSGRQALPFEPRDKRVYGRYALDDMRNCRLYDVRAGRYVAEYETVTPADGWFVCKRDGYFLVDEELVRKSDVYECITYGDGVFRVYRDGRWWYYR